MAIHTFARQHWWEGWSLFVGVVASAVTVCIAVDCAALRERLRLEDLAAIMAEEMCRQSEAGVTRLNRVHTNGKQRSVGDARGLVKVADLTRRADRATLAFKGSER